MINFDTTFYDTRFDNDGLLDRLITLMQMAIAILYWTDTPQSTN